MARIPPVDEKKFQPSVRVAFERHAREYNTGITNMKGTLGHSLLSFEIYMQWYSLYQQVEKIIGRRMAYLYAWSISKTADCPLGIAFFRKIITDDGEDPDCLELTASQKDLVDFGASITRYHGNIANHVYNNVASHYSHEQMVILIAFAGQMVANNIFNNVAETDIDEYLMSYLPALKCQ